MNASFGNIPRTRLIVIGAAVLVIIIVIVAFLKPKNPAGDPNLPKSASLTVWGLSEDRTAFTHIIEAYQLSSDITKNYKITFVPFDTPAQLESQLVNALAENSGPDIFYFHNTWTVKHRAKTQPAYSQLLNPVSTAKLFPQTVANDFMDPAETGTLIYALPLNMDALGVVYNKDIMQASGVTFDDAAWENLSWTDFIHASQTSKNVQNAAIMRAGAALGTTANVSGYEDILSALLLQSQSPFLTSKGTIAFDANAKNAVLFYTQFANRASDNYTWNESMPNSREAFARGASAMIVDYYSSLADIHKKNQFIDARIVPLPQLSTDASVKRTAASYWGLAVSNFSKQKYAAWHFVRFASLSETANAAYLQETGKLPALMSLIQKGATGENGAFLKSFLFARSWRQPDPAIVRAAFGTLIDSIQSNRLTADQALRSAQDTINSVQ